MNINSSLLSPLATELAELTLAASAACLLVLLIRLPMRAWFGARVAYALWWLLPAAMLAVLLPAPSNAPAAVELAAATVAVGVPVRAQAAPSSLEFWQLLTALWLTGCTAAIASMARQQQRFRRSLGVLEPITGDLWRARARHGLPAVIGLRARIVLPEDFEHRYAPEQQALVLAHERVHVRRGDVYCNLGFALLCALQWFNPLLWLAQRAYRLDQELACDACVLALNPASRRRYGETLLGSSTAFPAVPLGCPAFGTHPLKERITMLTRPLPSFVRLGAGFLLTTCLGLSCAGLAWAQQAPRPHATATATAVKDTSSGTTPPASSSSPPQSAPASTGHAAKYPDEAIRQGQEGEVLLRVRVLADGTVGESRIERSSGVPLLDKAALESVASWTFNPGRRDEGAEGDSWVLVPIRFSLDGHSASVEPATVSTTAPTYRRLSPPAYPSDQKTSGAQGTTLLRVSVDASGNVSAVGIEASSGHAALDRAATEAVARWTFNPANADGKPVDGEVLVPVQFLADESSADPFSAPPGALDTIVRRAN